MSRVPPNNPSRPYEPIAEEKADKNQKSLEKKEKDTHASMKTDLEKNKMKVSDGVSRQSVEKSLDIPKLLTVEESKAAIKSIRSQSTSSRTKKNTKRKSPHSASSKSASSSAPKKNAVVINKLLIRYPETTSNSTTSTSTTSQLQSRLPETAEDLPPPYSLHDSFDTSKGQPPTSDDTKLRPSSYISTPPPSAKLHEPAKKSNEAQSGVNKKQTVKLSKAELNTAMAVRKTVSDATFSLLKAEKKNPFFTRENIDKMVANLDICLGLTEGKLTLDQASHMFLMADYLMPYMPQAEIDNLNLIIDNAMTKNSAE